MNYLMNNGAAAGNAFMSTTGKQAAVASMLAGPDQLAVASMTEQGNMGHPAARGLLNLAAAGVPHTTFAPLDAKASATGEQPDVASSHRLPRATTTSIATEQLGRLALPLSATIIITLYIENLH